MANINRACAWYCGCMIFFDNPAVVKYLQPIGDIFIRLIKMIVVPIVVASIVVGVAGVGDVKN